MVDKSDDTKKKPAAGASGSPESQGPTSAPEIDPTLLTALQKRRIEEEFDLENDDNPQKLKAAVVPEPAISKAKTEDRTDAVADEASDKLADIGYEKQAEDETEKPEKPAKPRHSHNPFKAFWRHKKWTIPLLLLAIIGGLAGVPYTRYFLAGYVLKQDYTVTVYDSSNKKPVSSATVVLDDQKGMTDKDGKLVLHDVKPGHRDLKVSKKYYKDNGTDVLVPIYGNKGSFKVELAATGRQVPISVTNKLTGKPMENVTLKSVGTEVKTDKDGKAMIVLPVSADKPTLEVSLTADGYNQLVDRVTVTDQEVGANKYAMVPSGRVYFLSGQSGKIDVVKTNLDGSDRQTVVYGTGKEEDRNTVLLASRDWKYLALLSKRDSKPAKLYLIDTTTEKMTTMDDSDATFTLVGWSNHDFAFSTTKSSAKVYEPNRLAIKSYSADKKQLMTLDQNQAEGQEYSWKFQSFNSPYLIKDKLVYAVEWQSSDYNALSDRNDSIRQLTIGSQAKKDLRTFPAMQYNGFQANLYEPGGVYYAPYSTVDNKNVFFEYEDGKVKDADIDQDKFFSTPYPTYLFSPDGIQTFWSEQRDGRPTFFVGDQDAKNSKQVGVIDEGAVFGWYGSDYLLVSKKGSELYVMPVDGGTPLKISDYHKPSVSFRGYGGGYGGL